MKLHSDQFRSLRRTTGGLALMWIGLLACPPAAAADAGVECELVVRVAATVPLVGSMKYRILYGAAPGVIAGHGSDAACTSLLSAGITAFHDDEKAKVVSGGFAAVEGVATPADLVSCVFRGTAQPSAADFGLVVEDAFNLDLELLDPVPTLELTTVTCEPLESLTTTTTAESTTTTVAECGDGIVQHAVEECDDGNQSPIDICVNCRDAFCGDGYQNLGVEECDDFRHSDFDACVGECKQAVCGDGYVWTGHEQCDDGGTAADDDCSPSCADTQRCGDPVVDGEIQASDALRTLQRAVNLDVECPRWVCDLSRDGKVTAIDALALLREAVSLPGSISCGPPTGVLLRLLPSGNLAALLVEIESLNPAGVFPADGADVRCEGLIPGAAFAFQNKPIAAVTIGVITTGRFRGPRSVARCEYETTPAGSVDAFRTYVPEAVKPNGERDDRVNVMAVPD